MTGKPRVFICYVKQDSDTARWLYTRLAAAGVEPWLDDQKLALGDDWEREIRLAVAEADLFVACLRPGFDEIGFRQKEVRWALDALQTRPPGRGFIVPVVVEPCELPRWCQPFHAGNASEPTDLRAILDAISKHCRMELSPSAVLQLEGKNFALPSELEMISPDDLPALVNAIKQRRFEEYKKALIRANGGVIPVWTGH